jgi:hypothetical protein
MISQRAWSHKGHDLTKVMISQRTRSHKGHDLTKDMISQRTWSHKGHGLTKGMNSQRAWSHKGHDFSRKLVKIKFVFLFSRQRLSENFFLLNRIKRVIITNVLTQITCYTCYILVKLALSQQIQEESSNIKFHKNPSIWSPVVQLGQTEGQTDMTKLIIAFRNFVNAPKIEFSAT